MTKTAIKVVLADGRKLFREGLCALLERHPGLQVAGEAEEARAAVKLAQAVGADVVVLNASMPPRDVADMIRAIRSASEAEVVVLSIHPDAAFIREILQAGAKACLARESASAELVEAIRAVMNREMYLSPRVSGAVVRGYLMEERNNGRARLAPREREILRRIADGETTKQIALSLRIGAKTVETHRRRIMEKLHKHSLAELTKYAIKEGLTSLEMQA